MYSQSKGRQFQAGEHSGLVAYLRTTCPLDPAQETDQDRKLGVILSKVTQHNQGSFGQSFIIDSTLSQNVFTHDPMPKVFGYCIESKDTH